MDHDDNANTGPDQRKALTRQPYDVGHDRDGFSSKRPGHYYYYGPKLARPPIGGKPVPVLPEDE